MQRFAVFDIDGTIIRWQLFHSIVNELIRRGQISDQDAHAISEARMTWKRRENDDSFREYEHVLVKAYLDALTGLSVTQHNAAVENVFDEYKEQTYTFTRNLIRDLKHEGYLLFAISGSQQEIVTKFAEFYGFDDAIGAHLEQLDGKFTGKVQSPVHDKQRALHTLLARHNVSHDGSVAVGDSESDAPLLDAVEQPIAFNPSAGLLEIAKERGWKVTVERKNVIYTLEPNDGRYILA